MKREKMIQVMDLLDEKYIAEADPANAKVIRSKKICRSVFRCGSIAACIAVVLGGIMFINREVGEIPSHEETTSVSENDILENINDTEPEDIVSVIPMTAKWDVFDLLGKPAQFILLADEQADAIAYETNPLLYQENEDGVWMFWSILDNNWTISEILDIYNITSEHNIRQIDTTEKNTKAKEKTHTTDQEIIKEFYEILQTAEVMHMTVWGENHSLQEKSENDIDTVLYVDILTANDDVFSLQLYQHADCLVQNGETFYQLERGEGERIFSLLKGMSTEEFKDSLADPTVQTTGQDVETEEVIIEN